MTIGIRLAPKQGDESQIAVRAQQRVIVWLALIVLLASACSTPPSATLTPGMSTGTTPGRSEHNDTADSQSYRHSSCAGEPDASLSECDNTHAGKASSDRCASHAGSIAYSQRDAALGYSGRVPDHIRIQRTPPDRVGSRSSCLSGHEGRSTGCCRRGAEPGNDLHL